MYCKNCNCPKCVQFQIRSRPVIEILEASYNWPDVCRWCHAHKIVDEIKLENTHKNRRSVAAALRYMGVPQRRDGKGRYFKIPKKAEHTVIT